MLEQKIKEITLDQGKISSLKLQQNQNTYLIKLTPEKITVSKKEYEGEFEKIATYDANKESVWNMKHVCGANGFGLGLDDVCYACSTVNSKMPLNKKNEWDLMVGSHYKKELHEFILSIDSYCSKIEAQLSGLDFISKIKIE